MINFYTRDFVVSFDTYENSLDDLLIFSAQLDMVVEKLGGNCPEWLKEQKEETAIVLAERIRAEKKRQLKTMKARRETLLTASEKREKLDSEIAELEKELT